MALDIFFRSDVASIVVGVEVPLLEQAQSKQFMQGVNAMATGIALAIGIPRDVFMEKIKLSLDPRTAGDLFGYHETP